MIWEDRFSWQCSYADDKEFFLRRDKTHPERFTDHQFGSLPATLAAKLLAEFIANTGSDLLRPVIFSSVTTSDDNRDVAVAKHDALIRVARSALEVLNVRVKDTRLIPNGPFWDTVLYPNIDFVR